MRKMKTRMLGILMAAVMICTLIPVQVTHAAMEKPTGLELDGTVLKWNAVSGADDYWVGVYDSSECIKYIVTTETSYDFAETLNAYGSCSLNFYVEARAGEEESSSYVWFFFLKEGDTEVTSIGATITAPKPGATPNLNPASLDSSKYSVDECKWFKGGTPGNPGTPMQDGETFERGQKYIVAMRFVAASGYALNNHAADSMVTLNGETGGYNSGHSRAYKLWYRFAFEIPEETFTVTFNANGHGTAPSAQTIEKGKTASKPADPTAEGYTFGGWFTDPDCTDPYNFSKAVTGDITLYAKWTINTYTVTAHLNGGTGVAETTIVEYGGTFSAKPTREGYSFIQWYTDAGLNNAWDKSSITADIDLYARWRENTASLSAVITLPVAKSHPDLNTKSSGDPEVYTVSSIAMRNEENVVLDSNYTFTSGEKIKIYVGFVPVDTTAYEIPAGTPATINDLNATYSTSATGGVKIYYITYTVPEYSADYTLIGYTGQGAGYHMDFGVYWPDLDLYESLWDGEEPDASDYYNGSSRFYADIDETDALKTEPVLGETYYFNIIVDNEKAYDHSIDFSKVDPQKVNVTITGFEVTLLDIKEDLINENLDGVFMHFSAKYTGSTALEGFTAQGNGYNAGLGIYYPVFTSTQCIWDGTAPENYAESFSRFFTDADQSLNLTTDPVAGVKYYFEWTVYNQIENDHSIDFSKVDSQKVEVTLTDFEVSLLSVETGTVNGKCDGVHLHFSARYTKETPEKYPIQINIGTKDKDGNLIAGPGGTVIADKTEVSKGETVNVTVTPYTGYRLEEISFSNGITGSQTGLETSWTVPDDFNPVTEDHAVVIDVIFREIVPDTHIVSFNSHSGSPVESQTVTDGGLATEPGAPTKAGYVFDAWYTDDTYTTKYDFNTAVTGDITLHARWMYKAIGFTMNATGTAQDGSDYVLTTDANALQFEGDPITYTFKTPVLYTDAACQTLLQAAPEAGTTYYALVELESGGEEGKADIYWSDDMKTASTATASNGATMAYVDFVRSPGGKYATIIFSYTEPVPETCTVTFDSNGHGTAPAVQTVNSGDKATEPGALTESGWTFGGWYQDATCSVPYDFSTPVTADITIYAKWTEASAVSYIVVSGGNGNWTKGSGSDLTIIVKRSVADETCFSHFRNVQIDGTTLAAGTYDAKAGSTVVTLKAATLEKLSAGGRTITVNFDDGKAETSLTIKNASAPEDKTPKKDDKSSGSADSKSPRTGDDSHMGLWITMLIISSMGLYGLVNIRRKRRSARRR